MAVEQHEDEVPMNQLLRRMVKAIDRDWPVLVEVMLDAQVLGVDAIIKPSRRQTIIMHAAKRGRVS